MRQISISPAGVLLLVVAALAGCATSKEALLSHSDATMLDVWRQHATGASARQIIDARAALRRPLTASDHAATPAMNAAYTRTAANEIDRLFHRLPNPDLVMYVFPHWAGADPVPVPGYSTVFPLHARVQYALPGERRRDY